MASGGPHKEKETSSKDSDRAPFRFKPIEFDIDEILRSAQQTSKVVGAQKSSVADKHKAYKSSKGNVNECMTSRHRTDFDLCIGYHDRCSSPNSFI